MAAEETSKLCELGEAYPVKGGDGPKSYANNSTYQRGAVDVVKQVIKVAMVEKLDIENLMLSNSNNTFRIARLGRIHFHPSTPLLKPCSPSIKANGRGRVHPKSQDFKFSFSDHTSNRGYGTLASQVPKLDTVAQNAQLIASHSGAVTEELFKQQFGDELILDELFDLYRKKLEAQPSIF